MKVIPKNLSLKSPPANNLNSGLQLIPELSERFTAITDSEGRFTLFGLPESSHILAKTSVPSLNGREFFWTSSATPDLRVEPGGTIRGKLTNRPAEEFGDQLELLLTGMGRQVVQAQATVRYTARIRTQPDASFEINDVPPGQYALRISPLRSGFVIPIEWNAAVRCESRPDEITDGVELALSDVISVRGRVIDAKTGEGIAGASVSFSMQEDRVRRPIGSSTTDANGEYRAFLRPGKLVIEAVRAPAGYLAPLKDRQSLPVEHEKDFEGPTFQFERVPPFRGTIVDSAGKPVAGAEIFCLQPSQNGAGLPPKIVADETGKFLSSQFDPQDVLPILVRSSEGVSIPITIPIHELKEPRQIEVSRTNVFRMKGILVDDRENPVANATVVVRWHLKYVSKKTDLSGWIIEFEKLKTDEQGRFETSALWSDNGYDLALGADGFSKKQLPLIKGKAGEVHDYGTVRVTRKSLSK